MQSIFKNFRALLALVAIAGVAACGDAGSNPLGPDGEISAARIRLAVPPIIEVTVGVGEEGDDGETQLLDATVQSSSGFGLAWPD